MCSGEEKIVMRQGNTREQTASSVGKMVYAVTMTRVMQKIII